MKVLLIDDNTSFSANIKEILERRAYYKVRIAENGEAGIALARSWRPAVIYCDYEMPGMLGPQVIETLREDASLSGVRIVLISARDSVDNLDFSNFAITHCRADRVLNKVNALESIQADLKLHQTKLVERYLRRKAGPGKSYSAEEVEEGLAILEALRRGLSKDHYGDGFTIVLQPKFGTDGSADPTAAEVLFRLKDHWNVELVIALAEMCGYIDGLGDWVLQATADFIRKHKVQNLPLAVNVSVKQLRDPDSFIKRFLEIRGDLDPSTMELEITESHRADETVTKFLGLCHTNDVQVALDDFGEGLTGIDMFNMDFDYIKIDQKFIRFWHERPIFYRWVQFIASEVGMANMRGRNRPLRIVAEGVEDESRAKILANLGCHQLQGYHFSKPLSLDEFVEKYLR